MPYRRFDWHEHIREVWGEYWSAREAVDRLRAAVAAKPDLLDKDSLARKHLRDAHRNLEGTYIVRLFAAFEAALRSYDRVVHGDATRQTDAATMIAQIGGKRGRGIQSGIRQEAQEVRLVRNFRAHESDEDPGPLDIDEARRRLQKFLSELPEEW
ncbi:MAG: hypothetical protein BGO49_01510 [Planctomycetales bacterium 71-10]|nr:MAG: hypothetical protein BGO49_01510 [Planctomycetales bacterium 71-10]